MSLVCNLFPQYHIKILLNAVSIQLLFCSNYLVKKEGTILVGIAECQTCALHKKATVGLNRILKRSLVF